MRMTRRLIQAARIRPNCSLPNALSKFQRIAGEIRHEEIDEQELRAIVCPREIESPFPNAYTVIRR